MEEVVISGPGYDPTSTDVPGYTQEQLQSFINGTHTGVVPDGAQSKANSWNRVTKVVSTQCPTTTRSASTPLTRHNTLFFLKTVAARREAQDGLIELIHLMFLDHLEELAARAALDQQNNSLLSTC